ncbi:short-chain dehydrogenase [Oleiphilus sp. HI0071]|nr:MULTISPECIES: SDR family oxidoreductase [unclassified Oleiphilus]KZY63661.1 short-chain dehydrogenase [Oleiphilus sp. HI0065]KZY79803.1 short-chain dehydrogenase [Oleiphilus sp. HI0071]KZY91936.1 short-chain dehydrogenase [Oleiphilus sp. HI0073]KZZ49886.1 short-chain dehydrogenase [Oleiphilus sp. HI0118]KZZ57877.1 short-chain dehydrogenase [Oleiphilus sp. HI0122]KZZ69760.1 short-chain dehydrogenase [Oleiphilus sp. HI0130]KZZ79769.1 short-chain dehydrogenase [Oleiphilus sp. HI0133]
MDKSVLITGANRGIGLALAKVYHSKGYQVFAACRRSSQALDAIGVQIIEGIDVALPDAGHWLNDALHDTHLDLLINNAGILRDEQLGQLDFTSIEQQIKVNTLAPLRITEALLSKLVPGSKVAFITSRMGSIADNTSGGRYGYRMSKCALNAAAVSLAHDLSPRDISVAILHPGLVGTEMIGGHGNVTPDEAANQLSERIDALEPRNSGTFWHANGDVLPW